MKTQAIKSSATKGKRNAPLCPNGLFATPQDMKALLDYVNKFQGNEAIVAMTVLGMTWNLACAILNGRDDFGRALQPKR